MSAAASLRAYRVMAYVVGVGLLILVLAGVPLQYGANQPAVASIVGPVHGVLYIIYLLAAYNLSRKAHFSLLQLAAMVGAGFVPFLAFVVEHRTTRRIQRDLLAFEKAQAAAGAPGAPQEQP
jgi:integral membrane protein